jgi:hypothetical protein
MKHLTISRLEALCVTVATVVALGGLGGVTDRMDVIPVDKVGAVADIGAGLIALRHALKHARGH